MAEDFLQRGVARFLERLSSQTGLDSVAIALEYQQYRQRSS